MEFSVEKLSPPLARREELVIQELPDEVLVYDLRQHKAHCLNKSASFIWDQCDGATSVSELTQRTRAEFQAPIDENMVWHILERLSKAQLLVTTVSRPDHGRIRSRRAMLGKMGVAATFSVPMITTVIAPLAVNAATIPPVCTNCTTGNTNSPGGFTCPAICGPFSGECYANTSCTGGGNFLGCMPCLSCAMQSGPGVPPARAWRAGGTCPTSLRR